MTKKLVLVVVAALALVIAGCATQQQTRMAFDTTVLLTDSVMQSYVMIASQKCGTDTNCLAKLNTQHMVYANAVNAAQKAFEAYQAGGTNYTAVTKLMLAVSAARVDLTKAVLEATK
jgi:uncharacterized lipoprotein YajG